MSAIPRSEIQRHVSYDPKGYLFSWNGELCRAIYPDREGEVRKLFACGLVAELVGRGLLPATEITGLQTEDCALVLRHERVPVVTLPAEWSFGMLKDAAKAVIDVNLAARPFGYQTGDAHGFNVIFDRGRPLFTDIGSFVELARDFGDSATGWKPYKEFMRCFHAPLQLWSRGDSFFARHALHGEHLPLSRFWRHRSALCRLIPARPLAAFEYLYFNYKGLNTISSEAFEAFAAGSRPKQRLGEWARRLGRRNRLPFASVDLHRLRAKIDAIEAPRAPKAEPDHPADAGPGSPTRSVLDLLDRHAVRSVVAMAGSTGLPRLILEHTGVERVTCVGQDEHRIERLYQEVKRERQPIQPVLASFAQSIASDMFPAATDRLRSDAVIALELMDSLIFSQGLTLDFVLLRLAAFTSRYVFVDFRPSAAEGHGLAWFKAGFERQFGLLDELVLGPDRILLVGERAS